MPLAHVLQSPTLASPQLSGQPRLLPHTTHTATEEQPNTKISVFLSPQMPFSTFTFQLEYIF